MTGWLRLIRHASSVIVARSARSGGVLLADLLPVVTHHGLESSSASKICITGPCRWISTRRPARCLPQLISCQATEMILFVVILREIHSSPWHSVPIAKVSAGR